MSWQECSHCILPANCTPVATRLGKSCVIKVALMFCTMYPLIQQLSWIYVLSSRHDKSAAKATRGWCTDATAEPMLLKQAIGDLLQSSLHTTFLQNKMTNNSPLNTLSFDQTPSHLSYLEWHTNHLLTFQESPEEGMLLYKSWTGCEDPWPRCLLPEKKDLWSFRTPCSFRWSF